MKSIRKQKVYNLLKGIETGDPESVKVVNEDKYVQHNPQTQEGGEGLAHLFARLSKTNPKVDIVRLFEDGDYVFGHTIYDFSSVRIGFEVFRYEGDQVVEHWDNIQLRDGDMIGGSIEVKDHELTNINKELIRLFIKDVFIDKNFENYSRYVNTDSYIEHSTLMDLFTKTKNTTYNYNHRVLAEGNFILSVTEGEREGFHSSFYDLFRVQDGKVLEHWDTTEKVPAKSEWKNDNGKF
jgi:predicted SnoaL-like aldol condensation-catalyzing enzyme